MRYFFHEYAEEEFEKAVEYYNDCGSGLGSEFAREVYSTIERIIQFPEVWTPMSRRVRRCLVHRFPFGVIYHAHPSSLYIIAVADLRRKPNYWIDRL